MAGLYHGDRRKLSYSSYTHSGTCRRRKKGDGAVAKMIDFPLPEIEANEVFAQPGHRRVERAAFFAHEAPGASPPAAFYRTSRLLFFSRRSPPVSDFALAEERRAVALGDLRRRGLDDQAGRFFGQPRAGRRRAPDPLQAVLKEQ